MKELKSFTKEHLMIFTFKGKELTRIVFIVFDFLFYFFFFFFFLQNPRWISFVWLVLFAPRGCLLFFGSLLPSSALIPCESCFCELKAHYFCGLDLDFCGLSSLLYSRLQMAAVEVLLCGWNSSVLSLRLQLLGDTDERHWVYAGQGDVGCATY